ncbi:hypothetical protein GGS24DRAFT_23871 [Hypoxylon argillaceum]|nr:hypothetical protein GGS24DRAFT_23871 [Hypoxylon argillaceum]KAI1146143.1 hypothetical protein F4825DRAFT_206193 [Nemania diffusa]
MLSAANLPFIIGNDICRVARVRRILQGRLGPQFVRRILRTEEIQHSTTTSILRCILDPKGHSSPDAQSTARTVEDADPTRDAPNFARAVEFMAGRFAAKEAVIKAHPHRRLTFQSIAVLRAAFLTNPALGASAQTGESAMGQEGTQGLETDGEASASQSGPLVALIKAEGAACRDTLASVSISHDTEYATAVCLGINPASPLLLLPPRSPNDSS